DIDVVIAKQAQGIQRVGRGTHLPHVRVRAEHPGQLLQRRRLVVDDEATQDGARCPVRETSLPGPAVQAGPDPGRFGYWWWACELVTGHVRLWCWSRPRA